jgi:serine-type D-Ala-D-Ala carboxypeptidase/endopeptidase (penicillin-binding protein 4)
MKPLIERKLPYDWRRMIVVCLIAIMIGGDLCISTTTSWAVNRGHATLPVSAEGAAPAMMEKARGTEQLDVATRIEEIMRRPEFQNARWGMKFYSPDTNQVIYSLNSDQLFQPASAVKVFVEGSAFDALGPDYLFRTQVYRTGPVVDGVLKGDLVLVAGGDLLLGGRVQPDGTLALPEPDHTYGQFPGAVPVSDDPLRSIRKIARQVAARRIRRIEGRVLVDASLFREAQDEVGGTGKVTVSPMMINDNLVDVIVTPGSREGEPGALRISPETAYVKVVNQTQTTAASEPPPPLFGPGALRFVDDVTNADGTHTVTLTGNIPLGSQPVLRAYRIPEPARFAAIALAEELRQKGISVEVDLLENPVFQALSAFYKPRHRVAKIVPPPLSEQVKVMLKVSSTPHTVQWPYLVGAIAGGDRENAKETGREFQRRMFEKAGLEPPHGGDFEGLYTADFFIKFLTYMSQQAYFPEYRNALPIMGIDGSLAHVQPNSPAAGHVYAKTGSGINFGAGTPHIDKALAGFIQLPDGRFIVFAEFLAIDGQISLEGIRQFDQTMGEIASVVYESLAH